MGNIYVVISMDCEPVRDAATITPATSGPVSYKDSATSIRGYTEQAEQYGFPISFFVHPEVAVAHPALFLELEQKKGACLGLHIHPYKIRNTRYHTHFGSLSATEQTILLAEAGAVWEGAIGRRPVYFRPGTFSANDHTFGVLHELGYRGGSLSCPGRQYADLYAVWTGAPPDPHYGNAAFRMMEGDLDFVNVPLTVDLSQPQTKGNHAFCLDLRPDYLEADYVRIARNVVAQLQERNPVVPTITIVTHNDHDFTDPTDRVNRHYGNVLSAIVQACGEEGIQPVGATIETICDLYRIRRPPATPQFVIGHASIQSGQ